MINNSKNVPVVMAVDNDYAFPYVASVYSLYKNKNQSTNIQLYTIISNDFMLEICELVRRISASFNQPEPIFLNASNSYDDQSLRIKHTTQATYYRLDLPSLLNHEDKCIYLDCDLIVKSDISELYDIDLEGFYLAGVKAAGYYCPIEDQSNKAAILGIPHFDQYVNAGVLLMNLKMMRKDDLSSRFRELLSKEFESQDQDILNSACYGKIKLLSPKFNLMTKYKPDEKNSYENIEAVSIAWSKEEWEEACENPLIIHYADGIKPWNASQIDKEHFWWQNQKLLEEEGYSLSPSIILPSFIKSMDLLRRDIDNKNSLIAKYVEDIHTLQQQRETLTKDVEALRIKEQELIDVYKSRSWKIGRVMTAPIRLIKNRRHKAQN